MPIASDLEKLVLLRDSGDLSQAEFEQAKEQLLSGEIPEMTSATETNPPPLTKEVEEGKPRHFLLNAILSTIAATLAGGAAFLNPSTLSMIAFAGFSIGSTLTWIEFAKRRGRSDT